MWWVSISIVVKAMERVKSNRKTLPVEQVLEAINVDAAQGLTPPAGSKAEEKGEKWRISLRMGFGY